MYSPAIMGGRRCGPVRRYQNLVFWACEGLVVCQDERPGPNGKGDYRVLLPDVLENRVKQMADKEARRRETYPLWQRIEMQKNLANLQAINECVKEARAMGDPSDPRVQAFWSRHRPGAKSTVSLSSHDYNELPEITPGPYTGRTAPAGIPLARKPQRSTGVYDAMVVHRQPRRKTAQPVIILG